MEVRNLFYNIPVRRTFLKSDMTESGHVAEMFSRIALAHPQIHLTFRSGGKIVHDLPPVDGHARADRDLLRPRAGRVACSGSRAGSTRCISGAMSPTRRRAARRTKGQFLFLGGRYVRDRSLGHALNEAYRGLLMVGRMPVAFLHLEVPPEEVDVNVHPTKIEVRFRDSQRVYSHLLSTLAPDVLEERPAREAAGGAGASGVRRRRPAAIRRRRVISHRPRAPSHGTRRPSSAPAWGGSTWPAGPPTGKRSLPGSSPSGGKTPRSRLGRRSRLRRRGHNRCPWDSRRAGRRVRRVLRSATAPMTPTSARIEATAARRAGPHDFRQSTARAGLDRAERCEPIDRSAGRSR